MRRATQADNTAVATVAQLDSPEAIHFEPIKRLARDIRAATTTLSQQEARYLVSMYYVIQEERKAAKLRCDALSSQPHECIAYVFSQMKTLEQQIKRALDAWSDQKAPGQWAKSIVGIGPVIAAGLLAHIDPTVPTVGHIWRFAGVDPTVKWEKGQKRPWNADLKTLLWKIGQSFVKTSNKEDGFYGKLWRQRRDLEAANNEKLMYREQAEEILRTKKIGKDTDAYKAYSVSKLPPAHIMQRACRWTVKLFLSHYHAVAYRDATGGNAPKPYVLDILGHAHEIQVPNWPFGDRGVATMGQMGRAEDEKDED